MLRAQDEAGSALKTAAAAPALAPGARIGTYEIVDRLGAGGMGEVYRARDTKLRREVAVKILPPAVSGDVDRVARLEREARVLAALNHPNIAAIYGVEEGPAEAGRHVRALVLELVEGETLGDRIARGPLSMAEALGVARQIAEALDAAHEKGIVHRDLKPANIKVTPNGTVKVLDFGLAKASPTAGRPIDGTQTPTLTVDRTLPGVVAGTPAYMSPEQARGQAVDKRTDIWAFGCVFYEMLTGRPAFPGATISDTLAAILDREPDWSALPTMIAPGVCVLLRRCLQKDASRRLHDIADARIEIEDAISTPSEKAVDLRPSSFRRYRHEHLAWTIAVLAVAVLGMAGFAVSTVVSFRSLAPAPTTTRFEIPTPPTVDPASFALSSDGRQLAFVATTDGIRRLFVRSLDELTAQPLPGTEGALFPFWSPDGRAIGFFADLKLKRINLPEGPAQVLADANGWGAAWNADDVIVFAPNAGGPLARVAAVGGDPVVVTPFRRGDINDCWPQFLPDGRRFLFFHVTSSPETTGVYIGSLDGGEPTRVLSAQTMALFAPPDMLLQVQQQTLVAVPFDAERGVVSGEPVPVAQGLGEEGFPPFRGAFAVASTGVLAYRTAGGERQRQLTWLDRTGLVRGTIGPPVPGFFINAELSPDGQRVAVEWIVSGNDDVWLFDARTGARRRFTFHPKSDWVPVWSADGHRIFFSSDRNGADDLFEKAASGTTDEAPLLVTSEPKEAIAVSKDGRFLLYAVHPRDRLDTDLWALPLIGDRKPFPIAQTSFQESTGDVSPDGKSVAYTSNESGRVEVYTQSFPEPGGKRQISFGGGRGPRWSPDGRELFYVAPDDRLMAVPITSGVDGQLETGAAVLLFRTRLSPYYNQKAQYSVAADGRFLMSVVVEAPQVPPITVVLNWDAALKP